MANTIAQAPASAFVDPSTAVQATFAGACTNPSRIVAVLTVQGNISGLTVSDGTNYTQDVHATTAVVAFADTVHAYIFSKANTSTSALTVTAAWTTSSTAQIQIYELTNAGGGITLDSFGSGAGEDPAQTMSLTTTVANTTVIAGAINYADNGISADTGFTIRTGPNAMNAGYHTVEDRADAGAAGPMTLTLNNGTPVYFAMAGAAYGLAGGGGGGRASKNTRATGLGMELGMNLWGER